MTRFMLAMMVKDEEAVIDRCLEAAYGYINAVSITDTGSTDHTQDVIKFWAERHDLVSCRITTVPWTNFAENRQIAFRQAQREAMVLGWDPHDSYALVLDADDIVHHDGPGWLIGDLTLPGYHILTRLAGIEYKRLLLLRMDCPWRYQDVQHAIATGGGDTGLVEGLWIESVSDGSSWTAQTQEEKFLADAKRIQEAYNTETDEGLKARYEFYLGQSHRDAGHDAAARYWYSTRVGDRNGYQDERCVAAIEAGRTELRRENDESALTWFMKAIDLGAHRPEGWYLAASVLRRLERYRLGYILAEEAFRLGNGDRTEVLFAELEAWNWGPVFELSICGFYMPDIERILRGHRHAVFLSALDGLPEHVRIQNQLNLDAYRVRHGLTGMGDPR